MKPIKKYPGKGRKLWEYSNDEGTAKVHKNKDGALTFSYKVIDYPDASFAFTLFCEVGEPYKKMFDGFFKEYDLSEMLVEYKAEPFLADQLKIKESDENYFQVSGSHGTTIACRRTGKVVEDQDDHGYPDVAYFDVDEFRKYFGKEAEHLLHNVDILDIGYMSVNGCYVEPDGYHREQWVMNLFTTKKKNIPTSYNIRFDMLASNTSGVFSKHTELYLDPESGGIRLTEDSDSEELLEMVELLAKQLRDHIKCPGKYLDKQKYEKI